jgi:D-amino-acid dehydrogenase
MRQKEANKIYVIGAGIIGISCAISLQRAGHRVVLLDKKGPAAGASFGNAGAIVNGSCIPTATPGITFSALKMMLTNGPLSIKPSSAVSLLPWIAKFIMQSTDRNYHTNAQNLVALTQHASSHWQQLLKGTKCDAMFKQVGWLRLFETSAAFDANLSARNLMEQCNTAFETLNYDEIYQLEPNLNKIFKHGFFQKDCYFITEPEQMLQQLTQHFIECGGEFKIAQVNNIQPQEKQLKLITNQDDFFAAKVVVATGAWSSTLTKNLDYHPPLAAERGYHLMLKNSSLISRPIVNANQSFVLSPMQSGLRLTSQVELAKVDAAPNYKKIRSLLPHVERMLSAVDLQEQSVWMGSRPSLPDSLPIISRSAHQNIYYAFGHQHLGLTLGPLTGKLITDLIDNKTPEIDLAPYAADRF